MQEFRECLASMGKSLEEEDYASILMASLPPSYDGLIEMLTQNTDTNKTDITLDMVYKRVCNAYDKCLLRQDENGNGQDESFTVAAQKAKNKKDIECFNCWKKGHVKANCWAKGGSKEGQGPRQRQGNVQANAAVVSEKPEDESWAAIKVIDTGDDTATTAAVVMNAACPDKWVYTMLYDSGTSRHMMPH
jgi:gag-polypeptide of LTR copia-type